MNNQEEKKGPIIDKSEQVKKPEKSREEREEEYLKLKKLIKDDFDPKVKKIEIDLEEFILKSEQDQYDFIKETLNKMYDGKIKVTKAHVLKCIKICLNTKDVTTYLPHNLMVDKKKTRLLLEFISDKKINPIIVLLAICAFLIATAAATYSATLFLKRANLNKDIDGDGIPDINLDLNADDIAEINIDVDDNNTPDINIDYKGNRKSVFGIDLDGDGKPDSNSVNDASTEELYKSCKINCDIDGDGWPELNVDIDGDGEVDLDIDINRDRIPDLNIDADGDGECDLMCDTDEDQVCDKYCIYSDTFIKQSGTSKETGNPEVDSDSADVIIIYTDKSLVNISNVFPTDQEGITTPIPDKVFTVENTSLIDLKYSLKWEIYVNNYVSDNFQYKVVGTNGGFNQNWLATPKKTEVFKQDIIIKAKTTQKYNVSFRLKGMNEEQNYDQGRTYSAKIEVITGNQQ